MHKVWLMMLIGTIILAGCGAAVQQSSASAPTATVRSMTLKLTQIEPAPLIQLSSNGVPRSPADNMPLLMGDANLQAYRDDYGILRSPIDHMPLLPGNPNVAPMPGAMPRK